MKVKEMWDNYIEKHNEDISENYEAWHFCNNEKSANELADLVVNGEKTATASGLCFYEFENEELPKVGSFNIILDWNENAKCITKTSKVYIVQFDQVTEAHAFKEGEGDKTLSYWREVHKKVFEEELKNYKKTFEENMMVVCEEFEIVWK